MKKKEKGMLILIVALAIVIGLFYWFDDGKKRYQWFETYRENSDQPYGARFISRMLQESRRGGDFLLSKQPLRISLEGIDDYSSTDYVFIGQSLFLDQESRAALVGFLEGGGNAFIASTIPPDELLNSVYDQECGIPISTEVNHADTVSLNFYHPKLKIDNGVSYSFHFMGENLPYLWSYYVNGIFCDSTKSITPVGYQDSGDVNFFRLGVGRGSVYLHSNPLVFTNYFLTKDASRQYASSVFSHLRGKNIIWDEYSKIPNIGSGSDYNSPLYYFLQQPSLKYAWWLLLFTVILYVVFAGRRRQRPIPVLEQKSNTSLEFVNLISRLHYKNGNHLDMAHKKMKYFLYFVRSRYGIHAEKFTDEHIAKLAEKSRVAPRQVEAIFTQYQLIEDRFKNNIEENRLLSLYDAIESFYKQAK